VPPPVERRTATQKRAFANTGDKCAAVDFARIQPSAEDIGARLAVPSSLRLEIIATGVPKHKIVGSIVLCMLTTVKQVAETSYPFLAIKFRLGTEVQTTARKTDTNAFLWIP
jgi:hypothetical protein